MPDFRDILYQQYVSTFTGLERPITGAALRSYRRWCEHKYLPLLSSVRREEPILELGCGAGYLLELLELWGFSHVMGIDISREQVELARARALNARVADVFEYLGAVEQSFGAVIAVDFFEHFTRDELVALVPRIHRVLRHNGILLIQTANGQGLFPRQVIYGDFTHLTIFTPQSLGQLLRVFGFSQLEFFETGPAPTHLRGRMRLALWTVLKAGANGIRAIEAGKRQKIWTENLICRASKNATGRGEPGARRCGGP
jgi:SAM-dependent methyltransferase